MATIGMVSVGLSVSMQQFQAGLKQAQGLLSGFAASVGNVGSSLGGLGGTLAAVGAGFGALKIGHSVVGQALDTEKAMTALQKATDLDSGGIKALKGELQDVSTRIAGVKVEDIYAIATAGAKMGVARGDLVAYAEGIAKISLAMDDVPAAEIADSVGKVNTVFGLGVKGTQQIGSAIDKLADSGISSASGILDVTQRISGTAAAAKIAAPEATALAAALLDTGTRAEMGATTLQRLIQALNDAEGRKGFAKALGISAEAFARKVQASPIKALQEFLAALNKMDAAAQQNAIAAIGVDGAQAAGEIQKLAAQSDTLGRYVGLANTEFATLGQLSQSVALETKRTGAQLEIAANNVKILADTLGQMLLPTLNEALKLINETASGLKALFASGASTWEILTGQASLPAGLQAPAIGGAAERTPRDDAKAAAIKAAAKTTAEAFDKVADTRKWTAAKQAIGEMGNLAKQAFDDTRTPAEKLKLQLEGLNALWATGATDVVTFARAVEKANAAFEKETTLGPRVARTMEELDDAARKVKLETESPLAKFRREMEELRKLKDSGRVTGDEFKIKAGMLGKDFGEAVKGGMPEHPFAGALDLGSAEARSSILKFQHEGAHQDTFKEAVNLQKRLVAQGDKSLKLQERMLNRGEGAAAPAGLAAAF